MDRTRGGSATTGVQAEIVREYGPFRMPRTCTA
jgi:hypothetical protein